MSVPDMRAQAAKIAPVNFDKALLLAEKIDDPWYRCQSLATVARLAPESDVARVADKSLSAAMLGKDGYQRVAVVAWPVRALVERGKVQHAQRMLAPLLEEAGRIEHPVSKISALVTLWQAAWPLPVTVKQPILDALLVGCEQANSWKAGRILRDVALVVASEDKPQAQRIVHAMRESVYKRQAQRRLDAGQVETVRFFFPPFKGVSPDKDGRG